MTEKIRKIKIGSINSGSNGSGMSDHTDNSGIETQTEQRKAKLQQPIFACINHIVVDCC